MNGYSLSMKCKINCTLEYVVSVLPFVWLGRDMCSKCVLFLAGIFCDLIGKTKLPYGQIPVLVHNGELSLQTQSGKLVTIALESHSYLFIDAIDGKSAKEVSRCMF